MHDRNITGRAPQQLAFVFTASGGGLHSGRNENIFEEISSLENLLLAWERFRKGKRKRADVMIFERRLEDNLFEIRDELASGSYRHGAYEPFTVHDPKQRTIHKAQVKDRVVHQAVVNIIEPLFDTQFIYDSYSCRVGKGTHAAVKRLQGFFLQASKNYTHTVYAVKCDARKFFASINHERLLRLLARRITDPQTMRLSRNIIESFSVTLGVGVPLGNLTSQLFANIYLHELDRYIKHRLHIRHYVRYCDDFVMLTSSRLEGFALVECVNTFLKEYLYAELHPNKVHVRTWSQGIDFLGYILLPHAMVLRPSTARRTIARVTATNMSSYLGLCAHADAHELSCSIKDIVGQT